MPVESILTYLLGVVATAIAIVLVIPIHHSNLRLAAPRLALVAGVMLAPVALFVWLHSEDVPGSDPVSAMNSGLSSAAPAEQQADWSMMAHAMGGPPPNSTGSGAALARAELSTAELVAETQSQPNNVEVWLALANAQRVARQFPAAASSYEKALKIDSRNADAWADYADALASANGRSLIGAPGKAIEQALAITPTHLKGLWLAASLDLEQRQYAAALKRWQQLRSALPMGSPDVAIIDANIAEAQQLLGSGTPNR